MLGMNILEPVNDLLEYLFCEWLLESSSLSDVVQQVTSCAKFHHNYDVLLCLDGFVDLDDMVVSEFEEEVDLLHQLVLLNLIGQAFFVK